MTCDLIQELLDSYVDGELDLPATAQIERHLRTCRSCSERLEQVSRVHAAIQENATYHDLPDGLLDRLNSRLPTTEQEPRFVTRTIWPQAVVAAAVVLVIGIFVSLHVGQSDENSMVSQIAQSHIRSLQPGHLEDVISTSKHTVKPWFAGKLDFAPSVQDFDKQGFTLVGGRMDYLDNRPVAAIVYRHGKHLVNLFEWPATGLSNTNPSAASYRGYHELHWQSDGMLFWEVSDTDADELWRLADLLRQPSATPSLP